MKPVVAEHDSERTTLRTYITGFVSSVVLTVAAYVMVVDNAFSKWTLAIVVALLALVQFMVQLVFFLHLGQDTKPRFKVGVFLFMLLVLLIIVVGSLWIMHSLNYRMDMSPKRVQDYMNAQIGL
jgi:cytochrome o ubiquinol oxidase operon protein cyoD